MIRTLISILVLCALIYLGATVNLGKRTFFGHVANIWTSDEAREMRDDVGRSTAPMLERARRAAEAGWQEYRKSPSDAPGSAAASIDAAPPVEAP